MWLNAVVSLVVAFLVSASVCTVLQNARLRRRVVNDSPTSSASLPMNTTLCLNTREDVAQFVSDLRKMASVLPLITTIFRDSSEGFYVSCAINGSSEPVLRAYLSRQLLTSLTPQELQSLVNELQQVDQGRNAEGSVEYANVCRRSDLMGGNP